MFIEDVPFGYIGRWSGDELGCTARSQWFFYQITADKNKEQKRIPLSSIYLVVYGQIRRIKTDILECLVCVRYRQWPFESFARGQMSITVCFTLKRVFSLVTHAIKPDW